MSIKTKYNALVKTYEKHDAARTEMAKAIQGLCDIPLISIFWQAGDGFVIADNDMRNAPLEKCLVVIKEKGRLSDEDYADLCI